MKFEVVSQKISLRACASVLNHVWFFVTTWTAACKAPLSTEFSKQEYWSGLPFSTPGDPPDSGIEPASLMSPVHGTNSVYDIICIIYDVTHTVCMTNPALYLT